MRTRLAITLPSVHAIRAVYTALQGVEGITRVEVQRTGAVIDHDGRATAEELRRAIEIAGFVIDEVIEDRRSLPVSE